MGRDAIVGNPFRKKVVVAFLAGGVVDDRGGVAEFLLGLPVDLVLVLGHLGPDVLGAHPGLCHVMPEVAVLLRRKVAGGAVGDRPAGVHVVLGLLPGGVGAFVEMAAHAVLVGGCPAHLAAQQDEKACAEHQPSKSGQPNRFPVLLFSHAI